MKSFFMGGSAAPTLEFVWGETWTKSYDAPTDAIVYTQAGDDATPASVTFDSGATTQTGTVDGGEATGARLVHWTALLLDTSTVDVVNTTVQCKFYVYSGEVDSLPVDDFTTADIQALARSRKVTTARDIDIAFPATAGAKYRVVAIPKLCFDWNPSDATTFTQTTATSASAYSVNYGEDEEGAEVEPVWMQNGRWGAPGFWVYPVQGEFYPEGTNAEYCVVVFPARADAHTIKLRKYAVSTQTFTTTNYGNASLAANVFTAPTQTKTCSVTQVAGEVFQVNISGTHATTYRPKAENLIGSGQTISGSVACHANFDIDGNTVVATVDDTTAFSSVRSAYDGVTDFLGASGYLPSTTNDSVAPAGVLTDAPTCALFEGAGTVALDLNTWQTLSASGSTSGTLPNASEVHVVFDVQTRSASASVVIHYFAT